MIFFPAIDVKDGRCVRLLRGDMERATVYGDDPAAQARVFAEKGCEWLHVVDLEGAVAGRPANAEAVEAILAAVDVPVQLGGGIRDADTVKYWLDAGVRRVVLGTAGVRDPDMVAGAATAYPGCVALAIDARDGLVATDGWTEVSDVTALDLARRFEDAGVAAFVYTDIERDGAMEGPNVEATMALADAVGVPVIASGGIRSLADLAVLRAAGAGVLEGVIAGRALYDGGLDVTAAVAALRETGA